MLKTLLCIGTGSFIGGILRYLLSRFIQTNSSFPWGTLVVNITGCLILGVLYGIFESRNISNANLRFFLTIGLCGGFTTFSTFINESHLMVKDGNILFFILYTSLSLTAGLTALYLGNLITKFI